MGRKRDARTRKDLATAGLPYRIPAVGRPLVDAVASATPARRSLGHAVKGLAELRWHQGADDELAALRVLHLNSAVVYDERATIRAEVEDSAARITDLEQARGRGTRFGAATVSVADNVRRFAQHFRQCVAVQLRPTAEAGRAAVINGLRDVSVAVDADHRSCGRTAGKEEESREDEDKTLTVHGISLSLLVCVKYSTTRK